LNILVIIASVRKKRKKYWN